MSEFHLVAFLIVQEGDRILLTRRAGVAIADGYWGLPGGHVANGESLVRAAVRETFEEVGVLVDPDDIAPVGMCRYVDGQVTGLDMMFQTSRF